MHYSVTLMRTQPLNKLYWSFYEYKPFLCFLIKEPSITPYLNDIGNIRGYCYYSKSLKLVLDVLSTAEV